MDRIKQRGELVVGTTGTMPPFNMTTKDGEIIGFDAELASYMAIGMEAKLRFETMPFPELLPALESGKIDVIISNMTITPGRNLRVAFVGPYFMSGKAFLSKKETIANTKDASKINSPDYSFVALKDSTSELFIKEVMPRARLVTTNNYDEAVDLVIQDKVNAMLADYTIGLISVLKNPGKGLVAVVTPITYEPLGIALPANDPLLVNWTENFLFMLKDSGELDKMKRRWLENSSWLDKLP
jgi:polar amino acid transport system substrate-binding protein